MTIDARFLTKDALYSMRNVAVSVLLEDQRKAEEAYAKLVNRFVADFNRIHWPIAFVDRGYDPEDIADLLLSTLKNPWDERRLRDMAEEIVDG